MTIRLNPYLNFTDRAREALEFYQLVFGGELQIMTFGDGGMSDDPAQADLVMHGHQRLPQRRRGVDPPPVGGAGRGRRGRRPAGARALGR